MSQAHHGLCSAMHFVTQAHTHTATEACTHTHSAAPAEIELPFLAMLSLHWLTMQFCRKVLCKPCSARVTSPEEDMEYKMGSCIGISRRQVNGRRGRMLSINACPTEHETRSLSPIMNWVFTRAKAEREREWCWCGGRWEACWQENG